MSSDAQRFSYGDHPEQHLDVIGADDAARGTVVLLHGGYWRGALTSALMEPIARDLAGRGWTVVNVEYRRVDAGGGWPLPREDASAACRWVAEQVAAGGLTAPVVLIGHSVGGQLALLAAQAAPADVAGVIALAPVTDVLQTLRTGLGEDAAVAVLAGAADPESTAVDASPLAHLPVGVPVVVIHGRDDVRVPIEHSLRFADAARRAGDDIRLHALDALEHRAAIDPSGGHWPLVLDALEQLRTPIDPTSPKETP
jgi:acetyl esterase/lipase